MFFVMRFVILKILCIRTTSYETNSMSRVDFTLLYTTYQMTFEQTERKGQKVFWNNFLKKCPCRSTKKIKYFDFRMSVMIRKDNFLLDTHQCQIVSTQHLFFFLFFFSLNLKKKIYSRFEKLCRHCFQCIKNQSNILNVCSCVQDWKKN